MFDFLANCFMRSVCSSVMTSITPDSFSFYSVSSHRCSPSRSGGFTAAAAKSLQSCPTLCDPIDCSSPGSSVPGIPQARTLEWVAISFSSIKGQHWLMTKSFQSLMASDMLQLAVLKISLLSQNKKSICMIFILILLQKSGQVIKEKVNLRRSKSRSRFLYL